MFINFSSKSRKLAVSSLFRAEGSGFIIVAMNDAFATAKAGEAIVMGTMMD